MFRVAQPAQHHREGREAEVRLRLAAAGGEEEQVHGLAVGVVRVGEAGNVQQEEGELEGTPAGRAVGEAFGEPLPEGARDRAVRHTECIERPGVRCQHGDAALHAVRGGAGPAQQLRGGAVSSAREGRERPFPLTGGRAGRLVLRVRKRRGRRERPFPLTGGRAGRLVPRIRKRREGFAPRCDPGAVPVHERP